MKLRYIANIRLPTERAHGIQIVENCEAFGNWGLNTELWIARRFNTAELRGIGDIWAYYGVRRQFGIRWLPCIDLLPLVPGRADGLAKAIFGLQLLTFALAALIAAVFDRADFYYSRDPLILFLLSFVKPKSKLVYEAHTRAQGRIGSLIERRVLRHTQSIFTTTRHLADELIVMGADKEHIHVAHDGIRTERFENAPERDDAKAKLGWSAYPFIMGYVGRMEAVGYDKGVGLLVDAVARVEGVTLAVVGGPDVVAESLRERWKALRGTADGFIYAGQVAPEYVPLYLASCDCCAIPSPANGFFSYYSSPMKLFEYMAAKRAILASDLPALREVIDEASAVLLPQDAAAWADAIRQMRDDAGLRARLADAAYERVMSQYTWRARTGMIFKTIQEGRQA